MVLSVGHLLVGSFLHHPFAHRVRRNNFLALIRDLPERIRKLQVDPQGFLVLNRKKLRALQDSMCLDFCNCIHSCFLDLREKDF